MADEAKVVLRLDVEEAKRAIASLQKEGDVAGTKVGAGVKSAIRRGVNMVGLGGAVQDSVNAVRAPVAGGVGDVIGETFNRLGYQFEQWALGSLGEEARAAMSARDDVVRIFGAQIGMTNRIPEGVKEWFASARTIRQWEEHGKTLINQSGMFQGPGIERLLDRIMQALAGLLQDAVDRLWSLMNPVNWFRGR